MKRPSTKSPRTPETSPPDKAGEASDMEIFRQLHLLKRLLNRARVGKDHAQARILAHINRRDAVDQQELLRLYPVKPASMSQILVKLERLGFITRPRSATDLRRRSVAITPAGRAEAMARDSNYANNLGKFFDCLTPEERKSFHSILVKLNGNPAEPLKTSDADDRL